MKLECPSCQAKYEVADSAIGDKGRNLRCAACGHYWFQKPIDAAFGNETANSTINVKNESTGEKSKSKAKKNFLNRAKAAKKPSDPHAKLRQKAHGKIKATHFAAIAAGWVLAFAIMASGLALLITNRNEIVKKWPKSASAFAALGAGVNLYGLEISKISVRAGIDAEGQRLVINGIVHNVSGAPKSVPYLRVNLLNDKNQKLATWLIDPQITILDKNQYVRFESLRRNTPNGVVKANIVFEGPPRALTKTEMALKPTHDNTNDLLLGASKDTVHAPEPIAHEPPESAIDAHTAPKEEHHAPAADAHAVPHSTAVGR